MLVDYESFAVQLIHSVPVIAFPGSEGIDFPEVIRIPGVRLSCQIDKSKGQIMEGNIC